MRINTTATEVVWIDTHHEISLNDLAAMSGLSPSELQQLVDCEALVPVVPTAEPAGATQSAEARFGAQHLALTRAAARLRDDFDLDENGLVLTLCLLKRIHELEAQLHHLRAQWPHATP
jgi:chaperone modulatory protein CbpM